MAQVQYLLQLILKNFVRACARSYADRPLRIEPLGRVQRILAKPTAVQVAVAACYKLVECVSMFLIAREETDRAVKV